MAGGLRTSQATPTFLQIDQCDVWRTIGQADKQVLGIQTTVLATRAIQAPHGAPQAFENLRMSLRSSAAFTLLGIALLQAGKTRQVSGH